MPFIKRLTTFKLRYASIASSTVAEAGLVKNLELTTGLKCIFDFFDNYIGNIRLDDYLGNFQLDRGSNHLNLCFFYVRKRS